MLFVPNKVEKALTNPQELSESAKTLLSKYMDIDIKWWKELKKFQDYSWKIKKVRENNDWSSSEITYENQGKDMTHQLHQQNKIIDKLSAPEKILTETFPLTRDQIQFNDDWSVKLGQTIKFNPEQKTKIQQLIKSQALQLAGYRFAGGKFNNQSNCGYLWTSIPGVYIEFYENEVYIDHNDPSCSFSAIRSEN